MDVFRSQSDESSKRRIDSEICNRNGAGSAENGRLSVSLGMPDFSKTNSTRPKVEINREAVVSRAPVHYGDGDSTEPIGSIPRTSHLFQVIAAFQSGKIWLLGECVGH
jgi:hypothetical protein